MKRELFPHQKEAVAFLKKNKKAILADSMGLGKSFSAISAAGENSSGAIIVVCPASLKINWEREIHMVYPEDIVFIVSGGKAPSLKDLEKPAWVVINYDILAKHAEWIVPFINNGFFETLILDEAHFIKGKKTLRSEAALKISEKIPKAYCLTGTPIMNRPIELFNLLKAIDHPLAQGKTVAAARREYGIRYCGAFLRTINRGYGRSFRFWDESGATRLPELRERIQDVFLRRTKEEVLDLPTKIISNRITELDAPWQKTYDTAWDEYLKWVTEHPEEKDLDNIMSAQQLVELMKLKQVCSQAKIETIVSDIENAIEQGEKIIVFSQFSATISKISSKLTENKVKNVTLTGSDKLDSRQWSVDMFQNDPNTKVFIANIIAGGVGLNLTAASIVIFADMDWSPATHEQAEDRAHRIGQQGTVNVYYYIVKDTIEEDIVAVLDAKRGVIDEVMTGGKGNAKGSMASEVLKRIKQRTQ